MVRKDSARNRERLVEAGREVFAERGLQATLDDIAAHAGVGTGTAYRHFRNKQELAAEVLAGATQQIVTDAHDALGIADPWAAIVAFFEANARRQAADRGLYQVLAGLGSDEDKARIWPEIVATVTELFTRAIAAGAIRPDVTPDDAASILAMLGPSFDLGQRLGVELWPRYLALALDGLRAVDRPPLPGPAPRFGSLDEMIAASKPDHPRRPRRR